MLIVCVILSNCEIKVRESKATTYWSEGYITQVQYFDGMKFEVFYKTYSTSQTGYAIYAINLTKDSLEVAYYRQQLKNNGYEPEFRR